MPSRAPQNNRIPSIAPNPEVRRRLGTPRRFDSATDARRRRMDRAGAPGKRGDDEQDFRTHATIAIGTDRRRNRVGGGVTPPPSHATVRAVPHTAVPVYWTYRPCEFRFVHHVACRPVDTAAALEASSSASLRARPRVTSGICPVRSESMRDYPPMTGSALRCPGSGSYYGFG